MSCYLHGHSVLRWCSSYLLPYNKAPQIFAVYTEGSYLPWFCGWLLSLGASWLLSDGSWVWHPLSAWLSGRSIGDVLLTCPVSPCSELVLPHKGRSQSSQTSGRAAGSPRANPARGPSRCCRVLLITSEVTQSSPPHVIGQEENRKANLDSRGRDYTRTEYKKVWLMRATLEIVGTEVGGEGVTKSEGFLGSCHFKSTCNT